MPALDDRETVAAGGRTPSSPPARRVVLGIGNLLNSDEGVGVHAVRALQMELKAGRSGEEDISQAAYTGASAAGVDFIDGGVLGLDLLPLVEECSHLLVLDAVDGGREPGSVLELDGRDIAHLGTLRLSQHQVTFHEVLGLALVRGTLPTVVRVLGVQPESLEMGVDLSPVVANALPLLVHRARAIIEEWTSASERERTNS